MALKKYKPVTAGMRWRIGNAYAELTSDTPEKSLLEPQHQKAGRNAQGHRSMRYKGGGHKKKYRIVDFKLDTPKTKQVTDALKSLKIYDKKTLFVVDEFNDNLFLSLRNISKVESRVLADLNTYDIVNADVLVLTENSAKIFTEEEAEATAE
jgi:hypothetical protein